MTAPAEMEALAIRCEQASGPDRELDALIRCAVFAPIGAFVEQSTINGAWCVYENGYNNKRRLWQPIGLPQLQRIGDFTASLDAATSLFPPNTMYRSGHSACGSDPAMFFCDAVTEDGRDFHALAVTEAGARAAAALRARSAAEVAK